LSVLKYSYRKTHPSFRIRWLLSSHILIISFNNKGSLSIPSSPTFLAMLNTNLLPRFLFGSTCFRLGISFIAFVTFSATNFISNLLTTVSNTFIHESISTSFSALSSSIVIATAALATFSLFLRFIRSNSSGFINDRAHSFYILSSQSRSES